MFFLMHPKNPLVDFSTLQLPKRLKFDNPKDARLLAVAILKAQFGLTLEIPLDTLVPPVFFTK
jgi:hypothetical protein